jgi:hypothetical protein
MPSTDRPRPLRADLFGPALVGLLRAVQSLGEEDFALPSGCPGWTVRDLLFHLVVGAEDVLITLVTPADADSPRHGDALDYWAAVTRPGKDSAGRDTETTTSRNPLDAQIPRIAAAYLSPDLLRDHQLEIGGAAARAAGRSDADELLLNGDQVLRTDDFLASYVLEWTLHHLDLLAHLPSGTDPGPGGAPLAASRQAVEAIIGRELPTSLADADALRIATGRRSPTPEEHRVLSRVIGFLPVSLG